MRIAAESCPVTVSEHPFQGEEGPLNGGGNYDPLKVTKTRCLSKIRLYAGTPEYLTLLSIESDNVMSAGNQQERLDTWYISRNPQRLYAGHPRWVKIQSDPHGDMGRSRETVARLRAIGGHESNRSERNTLSLNWRLA
jgi:hypothetical protein